MNLHDLIKSINTCVEDLDFVTARKYMEDNRETLETHKHRLNRNAQELLNFLLSAEGDGLTQKEIRVIHAINDHATHFNIRSFKSLVKEYIALMSRSDAQAYLNEDAKALLSSLQGTHEQN